ncbi:MAG: hypothetical protein ACRENY_00860 [Candidatus Dormibacteria bacterium]
MQRKEARGNMRLGILLTALGVLMLATAFIWAAIYLGAAHAK